MHAASLHAGGDLRGISGRPNRRAEKTGADRPAAPASATRKRAEGFGLTPLLERLRTCAPVDYLEAMSLTSATYFVISDSDGLQKEDYYAGKRCAVMMPDTGWRELIECSWNVLCAPEWESILRAAQSILIPMPCPVYYGSGQVEVIS